MDRQIIREQTMQLVYQMDITGNFDYEQLSVVEENEAVLRKNKAISVLTAIRDHIDEIDQSIDRKSTRLNSSHSV